MDGRCYSTYEVRKRAVQAVLQGLGVVAVAQAYGTDRTTLFRWVSRYYTEGDDGLRRRAGSGRPRKLEQLDADTLREIVLAPASRFGFETDLWTVGRVWQVLHGKFQVDVSRDTVWRRLRDAGLTYQKPEREYFEIDPAARQNWLRYEVPRIRRTIEKYRAILYFEDESNVSLTAVLGKTWAPRGQTPKQRVTGKRGSVAAVSAMSRRGHLVFRLYDCRIASEQVIEFLQQLLAHHARRHLVVVMDQAPPHVSKKTKGFIATQPRLHVFHLPKYSPDWNPDEKVWNHLKHHELKGHQAKTTKELRQLTRAKLHHMAKEPELVRGLFFRCCVADFFG